MKAYVGVTDGDWYRFLAARGHQEVNFWRPGGDRAFHVLKPGELFFFKTHAPHSRVVGGGFFGGFAALTLDDAWRLYGERNGVSSPEEMRLRVGRYRKARMAPHENPRIGCILLHDTVFFPADDAADPPPQFAGSIVQGKGYEMALPSVRPYFEQLLGLMAHASNLRVDYAWSLDGPVFGEPRLAPYRIGQRAFQAVVLQAYGGKCAVTGAKIRPVLQAAHIRPVSEGGEHRLDNGLLLRSDIHTLFDAGYVAIDPGHRLHVSPRLRDEFGNGDELYQRARSSELIVVPTRRADRPNREFLEWHLDEKFKAS